ncbi:hypothetical protein ACLOJK_027971 [Asimina triloba]
MLDGRGTRRGLPFNASAASHRSDAARFGRKRGERAVVGIYHGEEERDVGRRRYDRRRCCLIDLGMSFNTSARSACYLPEQMVMDDRSEQRENLSDLRKEDVFC